MKDLLAAMQSMSTAWKHQSGDNPHMEGRVCGMEIAMAMGKQYIKRQLENKNVVSEDKNEQLDS